MVSREEYEKYINELTKKDENNLNLKYLSKGYKTKTIVMIILGGITVLMGVGIILLILGFKSSSKSIARNALICDMNIPHCSIIVSSIAIPKCLALFSM